jgi:hypothetical protein
MGAADRGRRQGERWTKWLWFKITKSLYVTTGQAPLGSEPAPESWVVFAMPAASMVKSREVWKLRPRPREYPAHSLREYPAHSLRDGRSAPALEMTYGTVGNVVAAFEASAKPTAIRDASGLQDFLWVGQMEGLQAERSEGAWWLEFRDKAMRDRHS